MTVIRKSLFAVALTALAGAAVAATPAADRRARYFMHSVGHCRI